MKVNFNKPFLNYKGETLQDQNDNDQLMIDAVCSNLYTSRELDTPEEKYKAFQLCQRIATSKKDIEVSSEEAILIKKVCNAALIPGAYGQIEELLEGK